MRAKSTVAGTGVVPASSPVHSTLLQRSSGCGGSRGSCAGANHRSRARPQGATASSVQPSLHVSPPDDPYEREADRLADEVLLDGTTGDGLGSAQVPPLVVQRRPATRPGEGDGEPSPQACPELGRPGCDCGPADAFHHRLQAKRASGRPLERRQRQSLEARLGASLDRVRIHTDAASASLAADVGARAFTVGADVFFGPGEWRPGTFEGRRLLAHELVHVIQQGAAGELPHRSAGDASIPAVAASRGPSRIAGRRPIQRTLRVSNAGANISNPGGTGVTQTNAATVQGYLRLLCADGAPTVDQSGKVSIASAFCTRPTYPPDFIGPHAPSRAERSQTATGCTCICDMVQSRHAWTITVDDASWPHTRFDDFDAANGRNPGGTGGTVSAPSPNSPKIWGAATASGQLQEIDPWLVLGHELCGHAWLGNSGSHGPDIASGRGEGGHQATVERENLLRREHGIELRGTFKQPYCGESFWRDRASPVAVNWSSFLDVCRAWRKAYNSRHGTSYSITDTIP